MLTTALLVLALHLPVTVETPRVEVHAEAGLDRIAERLGALAGRELRRIESNLDGLPRWEHIEIRVVKRQEDIASVAPGGAAPPWAVGTAYPRQGVLVVAMRGRDGSLLDVEKTLAHELAHLALGKALGEAPVARWLTEGFAYLHSSDLSMERTSTLMGAVVGNKVMPLWELEERFPSQEMEANLAYAEAYDFVAWMARRGRWSDERDDGDPSAFRQFLVELAAGHSTDDAAKLAFGRRLADLEVEWLESLRSRYLLYPLAFGGATLWVLGAMLLVIGWWRRRRYARRTLARWEEEELVTSRARAAEARSASDVSAVPAEARSH